MSPLFISFSCVLTHRKAIVLSFHRIVGQGINKPTGRMAMAIARHVERSRKMKYYKLLKAPKKMAANNYCSNCAENTRQAHACRLSEGPGEKKNSFFITREKDKSLTAFTTFFAYICDASI